MPLELAAVAFDGAFTAERELNNLRLSRFDPWVSQIAVLEHHGNGMYFTRATSPSYGGKRSAPRPGLIGLAAALVTAMVEGAGVLESTRTTGIFGVLADQVRELLPADASALMLVAESAVADKFVSAVATRGGPVGRRGLSDAEVEQLRRAATGK
jgi:hypothetical protein